MPGRNDSLSRIAFQQPQQRCRGRSLFLAEVDSVSTVPLGQMPCGPAERLIQMAQIAGIWLAGFRTDGNVRAADPMTPHRREEGIGRVRHVAVVAAAAG